MGQHGGLGPNGGIGFQTIGNGRTEFDGVGVCPNKIPAPSGGILGRSSGPSPAVQHALNKCVEHFHLRDVLSYFPASRYWNFQWYEFSLFLAMAIVLGAISLW